MKEKLITVKVSGGLGKHIVFTSLLKKLNNKYGKLNVISAYPEVFQGNPAVEDSIFVDDYELNKQEFKDKIKKIYAHEPYNTEFAFDDTHILDSWAEMYGIKYEGETPRVYCDAEIKNKAGEIVSELGKFIIVQFSGGQSPVGFDEKQGYNQTGMTADRNYPFAMAQILVNKLKEKFPECTIVNCSLPNEYNLQGAERIPTGFKTYFELVKEAEHIICIDSMLQHIAATSDTPMTVLWSSTAWNTSKKYGWSKSNITNMEEPYMAIDYNKVVEVV